MSEPPLLRLESLVKKFGETLACDGISLQLKPGKIIGLLGENGAGKSTLVSLLTGQLKPDSGRIYIGEKAFSSLTTERAVKEGIGAVYQNFRLVPSMTVLENFMLVPMPGFFFTRKRLVSRIGKILSRYKLSISLDVQVASLSMGQQQQVEIVKLLLLQAGILLFDEPTSLLSEQESSQLFSTLNQLKSEGKSIVLITHKLKEALAVCDEIAVMQHGRVVHHKERGDIAGIDQLACWIVGGNVLPDTGKEIIRPKQVVLKADKISGNGFHNVSFTLRQGEIVSVVGLPGNGQKMVVDAICGSRRVEAGRLTLFGKDADRFYAERENLSFVSHIPENRFEYRDSEGLTVLEAFLLTTKEDFTESIWLDRKKAVEVVEKLLDDFGVTHAGVNKPVSHLSGGNLQKLLFARAFFSKPRLLIVEQPGQGLDVEAIVEIRSLLLKAREAAAILVLTSDLSEAIALSDTICVMHQGEMLGQFDATDEEILKEVPQMMVAGMSGFSNQDGSQS